MKSEADDDDSSAHQQTSSPHQQTSSPHQTDSNRQDVVPAMSRSSSKAEEAATVKLHAVAVELLPQESFIRRKRRAGGTQTDGGDATADIVDDSVLEYSDEFCEKLAQKSKQELSYRNAVMEVIIDGLLEKCDNDYSKVLLYVISNYTPEPKVRTYAERLLSVHQASAVIPGDRRKTCLHYAVEKKYFTVVQLLIEHDVYIMAEDLDHVMPIDIALRKKTDAIASFLIARMPNNKVRALFEGGTDKAKFTFQELITCTEMQRT
ncbi:uncharacterized protein LOC134177552 [Corticium candelabrum]|uniref:uncharacterized protein LOC134177552 n=1 Tax=Corticium candelabrum TaxID=121492 RepID=UPI002E268AE8|nr:uncharacterized protein LOC134177552 [Corticium candelabrum]